MIWRWLDNMAHALYFRTVLGRRCLRMDCHHKMHLFPDRWLGWVCDRWDRRLGAYEECEQ